MLNSKTKQKYNDKSLLWYRVWLVTDTNIVEEILELKQNISLFFILDIEERKNNKRDAQLSLTII